MSATSRPHPPIQPQPLDWALEALALMALLGVAAFAVLAYPTLPATIPMHFGFNGQLDGYGSREWIFFGPVVAFALYVLLTVVNRFPGAFNYPWRVTEGNAARLYSVSQTLLRWLKLEVMLVFGYVTWAIAHYATVAPGTFDPLFLVVVLVVLFGTLALGLYAMRPATWGQGITGEKAGD